MSFGIVKATAQNILAHPLDFKWTVQGLGMLRTNLDPNVRFQIWDRELKTHNVTLIHTHPWNFTSTIVQGRITNTRYRIMEPYTERTVEHVHRGIQCGPGGKLQGKYQLVWLHADDAETYETGSDYSQLANEIHKSEAADGTITVIEKSVASGGNKAAGVFWKNDGGEWVSAEPRPAEEKEVWRAIEKAKRVYMQELPRS